jgi:hypothetical protein
LTDPSASRGLRFGCGNTRGAEPHTEGRS